MLELAAAAAKSPSAWDEPGTLGFLVVFGMAVVLYFVFRSLAKHLRKINEAARLEAMSSGAGAATFGATGTGAAGDGVPGTGETGAGTQGAGTQRAGTQAGANGPERA